MKSLTLALLGAAAAIALPAAASAQTNLVANGGFETGDFTNWTLGNSSIYSGVGGGSYANSGSFGAYFGTIGSNTTLSQSIATQVGTSYTVSFALSNQFGGTPANYSVSFGGVTLAAATNPAAFSYTQFSYTGIATSASTLLQFSFRQDPDFFGLDNVAVTAASTPSVPEPATWALMILGFGAVGTAMRRRTAVRFRIA